MTAPYKYKFFHIALIIAVMISCSNDNQTPRQASQISAKKYFDFSKIMHKFKYSDIRTFSIDTIQWEKRNDIYTRLDSLEFFQIFQDTLTKQYPGQYAESYDYDFFYSKQKSVRGLLEFTILTQREGEYCDRIFYNIYDLNGKIISSFRVAGSCADGGFYETASGRFVDDSTYELISKDNYSSKDPDKQNIVTSTKTLTIIKPNGTIVQRDIKLKSEVE